MNGGTYCSLRPLRNHITWSKHIRLIASLINVVGFASVDGRIVVFVGGRGFLVDGFIIGSHN